MLEITFFSIWESFFAVTEKIQHQTDFKVYLENKKKNLFFEEKLKANTTNPKKLGKP